MIVTFHPPGGVTLGPNLETPGKGSTMVRWCIPRRAFSLTLRNKPYGMCSVSSDSGEASLLAVSTLFKNVDRVARRTTAMLVMERLCDMYLPRP